MISHADRFYNIKFLQAQGSIDHDEAMDLLQLFLPYVVEYNTESEQDLMIVFSDMSFVISIKDHPVISDSDVSNHKILEYYVTKFPALSGIIDRTLANMISRIGKIEEEID